MIENQLHRFIDDKEQRTKVSAAEVATAFLARAQRLNEMINALITLTPEVALKDARRADTLAARGYPLPLHGMTVVVIATPVGAHTGRIRHEPPSCDETRPQTREFIDDRVAVTIVSDATLAERPPAV